MPSGRMTVAADRCVHGGHDAAARDDANIPWAGFFVGPRTWGWATPHTSGIPNRNGPSGTMRRVSSALRVDRVRTQLDGLAASGLDLGTFSHAAIDCCNAPCRSRPPASPRSTRRRTW